MSYPGPSREVSDEQVLQERKEIAQELSDLWSDNEEDMGEMAAYHVSCEQLGIDPDEGYEYLALLS